MSLSATTDSAAPLVALRGVGKIFASGTRALAGLDLDIWFRCGGRRFRSLVGLAVTTGGEYAGADDGYCGYCGD